MNWVRCEALRTRRERPTLASSSMASTSSMTQNGTAGLQQANSSATEVSAPRRRGEPVLAALAGGGRTVISTPVVDSPCRRGQMGERRRRTVLEERLEPHGHPVEGGTEAPLHRRSSSAMTSRSDAAACSRSVACGRKSSGRAVPRTLGVRVHAAQGAPPAAQRLHLGLELRQRCSSSTGVVCLHQASEDVSSGSSSAGSRSACGASRCARR